MKQRFEIDPSHTRFGFTAKHMMFTTVRGTFADAAGHVEVDNDDPLTAVAEVVLKTASIDTANDGRDNHLRSADFFDVENHPEITFRSTGLRLVGGNRYLATGDLTIRGTTRPIELDVRLEGRVNDPWGNDRVSVSASAELDRREWNLTWNVALEAGGWLVSEKIKLEIEVALVRKLEAAAEAPVETEGARVS